MMLRAYHDRIGADAFAAALAHAPELLTDFAPHDGLAAHGGREYDRLPGVTITLNEIRQARASYPQRNGRWKMMEAGLASAGL